MDQSADFPFCIEDVVQLVGLRIRRPCGDGVYTDCPFCGDNRGKLKVNYEKNVWKCNYCQTGGGMLQLYAGIKNTSTSVAYSHIIMNLVFVHTATAKCSSSRWVNSNIIIRITTSYICFKNARMDS